MTTVVSSSSLARSILLSFLVAGFLYFIPSSSFGLSLGDHSCTSRPSSSSSSAPSSSRPSSIHHDRRAAASSTPPSPSRHSTFANTINNNKYYYSECPPATLLFFLSSFLPVTVVGAFAAPSSVVDPAAAAILSPSGAGAGVSSVSAGAVPFATIAVSKATLLSGSLGDCLPSPNVSTCTGGLASALAVFRDRTKGTPHTKFLPYFDDGSAFVQMHPLDNGVNVEVMRHFGLNHYFALPTIFTILRRGADDYVLNDYTRLLQANLKALPNFVWYEFVQRQAILFDGKVGLIVVENYIENYEYTLPSASTIIAAVQYLRSRVAVVVVINNDISTTGLKILEGVYTAPPDVFVDLTAGAHVPCHLVNTTRFCGASFSTETVNMIHLYMDTNATHNTNNNSSSSSLSSSSNPTTLTNVVVEDESITGLANVPGGVENPVADAQYYADQAFLALEAEKAIEYDPIIGTTNVTMPIGGWFDNKYPCFAAECPAGTLYGRALMNYVPGAEIAFSGSGGYRGGGWPAGNIRMSHMWEMAPFANTVTVQKMLGYKIYELLRVSLYFFLGADFFHTDADRFLQGAGFQVDYDATLPRYTNRLLAIRVRDLNTGVYEPLDRTRIYTVVSDTFFYEFMPDLTPIMQKSYRGEETESPFGTDIVQTLLSTYISSHTPYNEIYSGMLTAYTAKTIGSRVPMEWDQTPLSCSNSEYWDAEIVSCVACPEGQVRAPPASGSSSTERSSGVCIPATLINIAGADHTTTIVAVVVPVASVLILLVVIIIVVCEYNRRMSTRNTSSAPQSGDGVSIVFTDIQSSTNLWGAVPASMAASLEIHQRVVRDCITRYNCYEVKTIGDSFMIACNSADNAALMSVAIQEGMLKEAWPSAIAEVYACAGHKDEADRIDAIVDDPAKLTTGGCGALVRIGINTGVAEAVFDDISKGYDYYGPAVNVASRVGVAAQGGQILVSRGTCNKLNPDPTYIVSLFAEVELDGIPGKIELLQITPHTLADRKFEEKRIPKRALANYRSNNPYAGALSGGHPTTEEDDAQSELMRTMISNPNVATLYSPSEIGLLGFAGGGLNGSRTAHPNQSYYSSMGGGGGGGGGVLSAKTTQTNSLASSFQSSLESARQYERQRPMPLAAVEEGINYQIVCEESLLAIMKLVDNAGAHSVLKILTAAWRISYPSSKGGTATATTSSSNDTTKTTNSLIVDTLRQLSQRIGPVLYRRMEARIARYNKMMIRQLRHQQQQQQQSQSQQQQQQQQTNLGAGNGGAYPFTVAGLNSHNNSYSLGSPLGQSRHNTPGPEGGFGEGEGGHDNNNNGGGVGGGGGLHDSREITLSKGTTADVSVRPSVLSEADEEDFHALHQGSSSHAGRGGGGVGVGGGNGAAGGAEQHAHAPVRRPSGGE